MPLLKACGTNAAHIETCFVYLMTIQRSFSLNMNFFHIHVIYPPAVATEEVMMRLGIIVIVGLAALDGYLMNKAVLFTEIEGVVDRGPR
jgi:hypothetical protein